MRGSQSGRAPRGVGVLWVFYSQFQAERFYLEAFYYSDSTLGLRNAVSPGLPVTWAF